MNFHENKKIKKFQKYSPAENIFMDQNLLAKFLFFTFYFLDLGIPEKSGEIWRNLEKSGEIWRNLDKSGKKKHPLDPKNFHEKKAKIFSSRNQFHETESFGEFYFQKQK